ncbi:hypothetical protein [Actinoplanes sp. NPDC051411]|uniref:hypothetical protein n=1 Tax=Actinoplanes sp. NPDC051411 TaxID=3155522 RepID=UPI00341949C7
MTDDWQIFVDPQPPPGDFPPPILRLPAGATTGDAARAIERLLRQVRWLGTFRLFVGDDAVGLSSRSHRQGRSAEAAASPLVPHECRDPSCQTIEYRLVYDEHDMPACEICGRRMGLVR